MGARPVAVTATIESGPVPTTDVILPLALVDRTTTSGDYSVTGTLQITIPAGALAGSTILDVTALDDGVKENRRETLRFSRGDTPYFATPVDFEIVDSPAVQLSVLPGSVTEAGGPQSLTVTAALGDPTDSVRPRPIPVTLTWGRGTAGAGDFSAPGTTVTIPATGVRGRRR